MLEAVVTEVTVEVPVVVVVEVAASALVPVAVEEASNDWYAARRAASFPFFFEQALPRMPRPMNKHGARAMNNAREVFFIFIL